MAFANGSSPRSTRRTALRLTVSVATRRRFFAARGRFAVTRRTLPQLALARGRRTTIALATRRRRTAFALAARCRRTALAVATLAIRRGTTHFFAPFRLRPARISHATLTLRQAASARRRTARTHRTQAAEHWRMAQPLELFSHQVRTNPRQRARARGRKPRLRLANFTHVMLDHFRIGFLRQDRLLQRHPRVPVFLRQLLHFTAGALHDSHHRAALLVVQICAERRRARRFPAHFATANGFATRFGSATGFAIAARFCNAPRLAIATGFVLSGFNGTTAFTFATHLFFARLDSTTTLAVATHFALAPRVFLATFTLA